MTNVTAFWLAAIIFLFMGVDYLANDGQAMLYLARKFLHLVDWVEFWR